MNFWLDYCSEYGHYSIIVTRMISVAKKPCKGGREMRTGLTALTTFGTILSGAIQVRADTSTICQPYSQPFVNLTVQGT